jgi:hypothetical protein
MRVIRLHRSQLRLSPSLRLLPCLGDIVASFQQCDFKGETRVKPQVEKLRSAVCSEIQIVHSQWRSAPISVLSSITRDGIGLLVPRSNSVKWQDHKGVAKRIGSEVRYPIGFHFRRNEGKGDFLPSGTINIFLVPASRNCHQFSADWLSQLTLLDIARFNSCGVAF